MEDHYPSVDWDFIVDTIRNEKCILFIGPEIYKNADDVLLDEQLSNYLDIGNNPDIQNYYKNDGLFLFTSGAKKTKSYYRIKHFYQQSFPEAERVFKKLAQIPFHLIVSIIPDNKSLTIFKQEGVNVDFNFYWKKQAADQSITIPTRKAPLIYNIFGSVDHQESLVLTHDDMFDYFESIFQEKSMPEKLKLVIKKADNFIFLGLDFEKWYMQLLLRILYLHNERYEFMRYAANQRVNEELRTLCFQQFKIEFVPAKVEEFVNELAERCAQANLLRKEGERQISMNDRLRDWLEKDMLDEVIDQSKGYLEGLGSPGLEFMDDLLLISNQYRRLNRKLIEGIVDSRDAGMENNKIRKSLLDLLNESKLLESKLR